MRLRFAAHFILVLAVGLVIGSSCGGSDDCEDSVRKCNSAGNLHVCQVKDSDGYCQHQYYLDPVTGKRFDCTGCDCSMVTAQLAMYCADGVDIDAAIPSVPYVGADAGADADSGDGSPTDAAKD